MIDPKIPIDYKNKEFLRVSEMVLLKGYSVNALSYIPNMARTLNLYKDYKPNPEKIKLSVLPERQKKTKFTFVELVWIRIVFELRNIGLDFEIIRDLKDFLFATPDKDIVKQEIAKKKKEFDLLLKDLSPEEREYVFREFEKTLASNLRFQELNLSPLLIILVNCIYSKTPVDFRVYLNGRIALFSETPDGDFIKNEIANDLRNKSFISISLTEIISFYMGQDIISSSAKEVFFDKEELNIFNTINKDKLKSITINYKGKTIDMIEIEKYKKVDLNQRLTEVFLNGAYEDVTIKTQKGKIVSCNKIEKIKMANKNTG